MTAVYGPECMLEKWPHLVAATYFSRGGGIGIGKVDVGSVKWT